MGGEGEDLRGIGEGEKCDQNTLYGKRVLNKNSIYLQFSIKVI